ncbi:penicillin acylase family protein [Microbulbifer yueqingensis]|uniref:Penicillin amidase/acyl-homoserine-lactone acylase n=1 Tax=Microbulbifer yueqingensis TaxID=658219 RepID=A0A1G9ETE8_9GAMM|nr:acylase [Microbulbifer yueqingensis]SDK79275.1 penicillin amidase/acyl-homoserine-lactone acylase [Microbulbifer yueqingensis]
MQLAQRLSAAVCLLVGGALAIGYLSLPPSTASQLRQYDFSAAARNFDVEIIRDDWGVPHIYGESDTDVAFGLAYAHAEDDFATIQDVILATRGKLAAENGMRAAKTDYLAQWMGIWPAIEQGYRKLPQHTRAVAEAYATGLNLYAARNPGDVSRYLLPVTGEDLVAGFTFKAPMFYGFDRVLGELLDPDAVHEVAKSGQDALAWVPERRLPTGSQGIAVAPHRSGDGATRLLVNSHQPLTGPVAWYEARLHSSEGWNMAGATFPGAPVIIHGHNEYLGWANTVNKPDLADIYRLTINPDNPDQYLLDGEWRTFATREAHITVKLWGPLHWTVTRPIRIAAHGPVMETEHGTYAVRWAGMGEIRTLGFMLALNKAKSREEFEAALKMQAMPSINYVYADREGNIAHYYNAMFPRRIEGWDWQKYLPGDRSDLIWDGYRDFAMMPKTVNPDSGLVFNANNPPFQSTDGNDAPRAGDYPGSMGIESHLTNRALQIETLYGSRDKISPADFEQLKYDHHYHPDAFQARALRRWLASEKPADFQREPYRSALAALGQWDLSTARDNREAALAVLTLQPVQDAAGERVPDSAIDRAFREAVDELVASHGSATVPYGQVNRHVRGTQDWPLDGGPDTLRAVYGGPLNSDGRLENHAGDSYIMFAEWDAEGRVHSRAVHNFGAATLDDTSPHFADQAPLFAAEKLRPVYFYREALESHVSRRYRPAQQP